MLVHHGNFKTSIVRGGVYRHQLFERSSAPAPGEDDVLWVFIDGDGLPYVEGGVRASDNPTPRHPLALELASRTPGQVLYVSRPCTFLIRNDSECSPEVWTAKRYSAAVVASLVDAVQQYASARFRRIILVGYSGGGTLAVLMAARLERTAELVTIAANLDIDAWTQAHGYLPLNGSLNPSDLPPLPASIRQRHLVGDRDANVPARLSQRYLQNLAPEDIWSYQGFDHVCCWVQQWDSILTRIHHDLAQ